MSGTGRSGRERQKRCVWHAGRPGDGAPISRSAVKITGDSRWSCRFSPMPGRSATTLTPSERRCSAVPIPESRRSCADPIVPPHRTTSAARACSVRPSFDHSTPTQRVPSNTRRRADAPRTSSRVSARLDGPDVRRRRAVADAVLDAVLHERHAVLRPAVVVGVRGDAALVRRLRDRHVDRIGLERGDEAHRSGPAGLAPLDPLVDGPHLIPRPSLRAEGRPRIEVGGCAAHPDHRVQAARSPEDLATGPRKTASGGVPLRHRLVGPVDLGQPELVEPAGVVDRRVVVPSSGLEQKHARAAVHEAPCDHRAGRSGADHDDVGRALAHDRRFPPAIMDGHYASLRRKASAAFARRNPLEEGQHALGQQGRGGGIERRQRRVGEQVLGARVEEQLREVARLDEGAGGVDVLRKNSSPSLPCTCTGTPAGHASPNAETGRHEIRAGRHGRRGVSARAVARSSLRRRTRRRRRRGGCPRRRRRRARPARRIRSRARTPCRPRASRTRGPSNRSGVCTVCPARRNSSANDRTPSVKPWTWWYSSTSVIPSSSSK